MYKAPYQRIISPIHYITKLIESRFHFKEDVLHYLAHYGKSIHFGKPKIIIIKLLVYSFIHNFKVKINFSAEKL